MDFMRFRRLAGVFFAVLMGVSGSVMAAGPTGWGETAEVFMSPVDVLTMFVINGCLILGITFLFATFIRYRQYRMNPMFVPLSTVVFLFILAILLLCLPLTHYLLDYMDHMS